LEDDDVVSLALLPFEYEAESSRILSVHKSKPFEELREPVVSISEEASLITGITDEMVAGRSIDPAQVAAIVSEADLVIAHNAYFYRVMVEKHWDCFKAKPWTCTLFTINWLREGFSAGKLDYLRTQLGWFYDGHQAFELVPHCWTVWRRC